ncbi:MAG: 50S ribosomal protein L13 [Candidatus Wildermuthbacteria bacterium RIFCSPHIGHO2_02_FULL_47_12]|uniref:Large ribosomal subunit protein uL13 n=2 Tax=Parcubacteria group TaxID=1794811 RepID=A0A1G2R4N9_9BACT|nr:MAG: 50S ribosomal protein L13 [Candidatus Buchananbacteria bacterium RIFCSPLOWO2_01_FULL_46_12]OHA67783.1 MAG: 50S ribosomal protein L13 [Candidatus Wildermuthbacteria bacterium RIFCSPHIGHO2_02_FULL_47_12]
MVRTTHTIDAKGQSLGRLAAKVALLLRGKAKPGFAHHIDGGDAVVVTNFKSVRITGRKMDQKTYYRHSAYLGGLKSRTLKESFAIEPKEILRKAVWGMLPKNKLRSEQIKRLRVEL